MAGFFAGKYDSAKNSESEDSTEEVGPFSNALADEAGETMREDQLQAGALDLLLRARPGTGVSGQKLGVFHELELVSKPDIGLMLRIGIAIWGFSSSLTVLTSPKFEGKIGLGACSVENESSTKLESHSSSARSSQGTQR